MSTRSRCGRPGRGTRSGTATLGRRGGVDLIARGAHRFARYAADGPTRWSIDEIAATFGLGRSASRVLRSLERLERFDISRSRSDIIEVRLWLPPLTRHQVDQLPDYLAAGHTPGAGR